MGSMTRKLRKIEGQFQAYRTASVQAIKAKQEAREAQTKREAAWVAPKFAPSVDISQAEGAPVGTVLTRGPGIPVGVVVDKLTGETSVEQGTRIHNELEHQLPGRTHRRNPLAALPITVAMAAMGVPK